MKTGQRLWTRNELILVMNLYCKLPFGKMHRSNPEVIHLAQLLERTPGAVAFKLVNLASLDPALKARGIKGASNASRLDAEVWNEFYEHWDILPFESEQLLANFIGKPIEEMSGIAEQMLPREGKEREQTVKARVNQAFFRRAVMSAYNYTCCITGINYPQMLVAGHIKPWALDEKNRLNPENGIAINALHDKAFEAGLITITPECKVKVSGEILKDHSQHATDYFIKYHDKPIILPQKFLPDIEFLRYHYEERFIR